MYFFKRVLIWGSIAAILYILLGYHFIVFRGSTVRMLKKSNFTLEYTFFSAHGKSNESIMSIKELRNDGIGDLLVDMGKMTESERDRLMARYQ